MVPTADVGRSTMFWADSGDELSERLERILLPSSIALVSFPGAWLSYHRLGLNT